MEPLIKRVPQKTKFFWYLNLWWFFVGFLFRPKLRLPQTKICLKHRDDNGFRRNIDANTGNLERLFIPTKFYLFGS